MIFMIVQNNHDNLIPTQLLILQLIYHHYDQTDSITRKLIFGFFFGFWANGIPSGTKMGTTGKIWVWTKNKIRVKD